MSGTVECEKSFRSAYKGKKKIGQVRGHGGVYCAEVISEGQPLPMGSLVAAKMFDLTGLSGDELEKNRMACVREEEGLKKLKDDPYCQQIIEVIRGRQHLYLITQLYSGDLFSATEGLDLPIECARIIMLKLLNGLKAVHDRGMCHRDVKLENYFVRVPEGLTMADMANPAMCDSFEVVIADLGFWGATRCETTGGKILQYESCGSDVYSPPEQLLVKSVSPDGYDGEVGDIFGLGVCFFTLTNGFPPWESCLKTTDPYYMLWLNGELKTYWSIVDHHVGGVPDALKDLLTKMMSISPSHRPTLQEVLEHPFFTGYECYYVIPTYRDTELVARVSDALALRAQATANAR